MGQSAKFAPVDPPVYPHFVIYPPVPATGVFPTGESASAPSIIDFSCLSTSQYLPLSHNIRTKLPIDYPVFDLCEHVPSFTQANSPY